jgi:pilus assembly protein Flp/PilA
MLYAPREEGQGLVEYGLILVLIAILVVVILRTVGGKISTMFSTISSAMPGPPTPTP